MAILNIRNLPEDVHARLRVRAAEHGRSMEAEARAILTDACSPSGTPTDPTSLPGWVDSLYQGAKPASVVDDLLSERRREVDSE